MRILLSGSQGFIGSYLSQELLDFGYDVVGIDNYSKYGLVARPHDKNDNFTLLKYDLINKIPDLGKFDYIIAGAALIGGIGYFHKYAYDLLATNERIIANTFDYAIKTKPKKIIVISSSMVFENGLPPNTEDSLSNIPSPSSSYGFQKLATEYFAKAAFDQYGIHYNIVRPFNCVGIGEYEATKDDKVSIGNINMMLSHVIPDLINRALKSKSDDPVYILGHGNQIRHYTNGRDIARGIRLTMESNHQNEDFNISTPIPTTVNELIDFIWEEIHGCKPSNIIHEPPYKHDVQVRSPCVTKAKKMLGFEADIHWKDSVREVIGWMR